MSRHRGYLIVIAGVAALSLLSVGAMGMPSLVDTFDLHLVHPTPYHQRPSAHHGVQPERGAACERWVATPPAGNDGNPGTESAPWSTLEHAAAVVPDRRCTVWFADGTYVGSQDVKERFHTRTIFKAVNPYRAVLQGRRTVLDVSGARNVVIRGFRFQQTSPRASGVLVYVSLSDGKFAERITFQDNIFQDAYENDLLKLHDGTRHAIVRNNVFYNQGVGEEHIDVNGVGHVLIQDNLFFNDFTRSDRADSDLTQHHFITVKDSDGSNDGSLGSRYVTIQRNVFLNWEGGASEGFLNVGNDGKPYLEAVHIRIENNLMVGNARNDMDSALSVAGAKDVMFINNTVVGDLPTRAYAFRVYIKGSNPRNEDILFSNNIWSDPTGTMAEDLSDDVGEFSGGDPDATVGLTLDNNLYWNAGAPIPGGDAASPRRDDGRWVVGDPQLNADHAAVVVPYWTGSSFLSGGQSIRSEFLRLVEQLGSIPGTSRAVGRGVPSLAPADDILGSPRDASPDLGAFEAE